MTEQPGRKRDAAATRLALLDAAADLFADRGFDRTTVRDIAKEAGANQSLLFRYFGSKEALFEAVIARNTREQIASNSPERLFSATLRAMLEPGGERNRTLETYLRSPGSDSAAAAMRQELGREYAGDAGGPDRRTGRRAARRPRAGLAAGHRPGPRGHREGTLASADPDDICRLVLAATRTLLERTE